MSVVVRLLGICVGAAGGLCGLTGLGHIDSAWVPAMLVAAPALGSLLGAYGHRPLRSRSLPLLFRRAAGLFWGWGCLAAAVALARAWVDPAGSAASCAASCALTGLACAAGAWSASLIADPAAAEGGGTALTGLCDVDW